MAVGSGRLCSHLDPGGCGQDTLRYCRCQRMVHQPRKLGYRGLDDSRFQLVDPARPFCRFVPRSICWAWCAKCCLTGA